MGRRARLVRSASELGNLTAAQRDARLRALEAISKMRGGSSLRRAAREAATTPATVRRYAGPTIYREGRRWRVRSTDRLVRRMRWIVGKDVITIDVTESRTAASISRYWSAVRLYAETGNEQGLRPFHGKTIRIQKKAYNFVTDTQVLDELARRGEISFETIYSEAA